MQKLAFAVVFIASTVATAQAPKSDDRVLVYVDDVVPADKSLSSDATALTTALCAAVGKDKRFDVLCAPDVKQILSFAATAAMVGTNGGPGAAVQDRLDRTKHVVSATFKKDGANYVMVVKAGPKAADAQATSLYSDKPVIALEEKGDAQRKILEKLPALASRITAALVPSTTNAATSAPPPAPLPAPAPAPAKKSGGW
jgi:hypothetical protein